MPRSASFETTTSQMLAQNHGTSVSCLQNRGATNLFCKTGELTDDLSKLTDDLSGHCPQVRHKHKLRPEHLHADARNAEAQTAVQQQPRCPSFRAPSFEGLFTCQLKSKLLPGVKYEGSGSCSHHVPETFFCNQLQNAGMPLESCCSSLQRLVGSRRLT